MGRWNCAQHVGAKGCLPHSHMFIVISISLASPTQIPINFKPCVLHHHWCQNYFSSCKAKCSSLDFHLIFVSVRIPQRKTSWQLILHTWVVSIHKSTLKTVGHTHSLMEYWPLIMMNRSQEDPTCGRCPLIQARWLKTFRCSIAICLFGLHWEPLPRGAPFSMLLFWVRPAEAYPGSIRP